MYVGGLSYRVGERDLDRFFRSYGRLRDIVIKNGFGFVVRVLNCTVYPIVNKSGNIWLLGCLMVKYLEREVLVYNIS